MNDRSDEPVGGRADDESLRNHLALPPHFLSAPRSTGNGMPSWLLAHSTPIAQIRQVDKGQFRSIYVETQDRLSAADV